VIPVPAILLGLGAAFFLMRREDGNSRRKDDDIPGDTGPLESPELGKFRTYTQEELQSELEPMRAPSKEVLEALAWSYLPKGYEIPDDMAHNDVWVSEDCEAAALGGDWSPIIEHEGRLYDPASFWEAFAEGVPPTHTGEDGLTGSPAFAFTIAALEDQAPKCMARVPRPEAHESLEEYEAAWGRLRDASPAISGPNFDDRGLFEEVYYNHVRDPMLAAWKQADPEAYIDWKIDDVARWVVRAKPELEGRERVDFAYSEFVHDDPNAPSAIEIGSDQPQQYQALWQDLASAIDEHS
jgi:hypothetical protein